MDIFPVVMLVTGNGGFSLSSPAALPPLQEARDTLIPPNFGPNYRKGCESLLYFHLFKYVRSNRSVIPKRSIFPQTKYISEENPPLRTPVVLYYHPSTSFRVHELNHDEEAYFSHYLRTVHRIRRWSIPRLAFRLLYALRLEKHQKT